MLSMFVITHVLSIIHTPVCYKFPVDFVREAFIEKKNSFFMEIFHKTLFRIVGHFESQGLKLPYFQFLAVF